MAEQNVSESRKPPQLVTKIVNPLLKLILRSPLHGLVSDSIMILKFTGRKTGKEYSFPVGYHPKDGYLYVFTGSNWWKNMKGGAEVTIWLRGSKKKAHAEPLTEPQKVAELYHFGLERVGVENSMRVGLNVKMEKMPTVEELKDMVGNKRVVLRLSVKD